MRHKKIKNIVPYRSDAEFLYKIGIKYVDRKNFRTALKFLQKAADMEPYNADYLFNLACALAEIKDLVKSNHILASILKNIDPTFGECYFGLGCNYFDMGNLKKAKEYFQKYVYYEADGQFVDEAYDILYYLQIYDEIGPDSRKSRIAVQLTDEGISCLSQGNLEKACTKFEKALENDPHAIKARNILSLMCFINGEFNRAVSLARSVIKLDEQNLFANFLLLIYYEELGLKNIYGKQAEAVDKLKACRNEDILELIDICTKLKGSFNTLDRLKGLLAQNKEAARVLKSSQRKDSFGHGKEKILAVQKLEDCSKDGEKNEMMLKESQGSGSLHLKWKKEWEGIIECAIQKREFIYKGSYKNELKNIWMNFIKAVYPEKPPVIKKQEIWAAALEYIYCNRNLINMSKKRLAEKYNISPASITNKLKDFIQ